MGQCIFLNYLIISNMKLHNNTHLNIFQNKTATPVTVASVIILSAGDRDENEIKLELDYCATRMWSSGARTCNTTGRTGNNDYVFMQIQYSFHFPDTYSTRPDQTTVTAAPGAALGPRRLPLSTLHPAAIPHLHWLVG